MRKVLITDYVHPKLKPGLEDLGYTVEYIPDFEANKLEEYIRELEGIIINSKIKMTQAVMDKAPQLKFIGRLGSGLEIIDLEYAKTKNIHVINSPEGNRNAVAEHAMGMLLTLSNNLLRSDSEVRKHEWNREQNRGFEILGLKVGLIGFGNTGQALAKKLSGFGCQVFFYDPYVAYNPEILPEVHKLDLLEIQNQCDIISFHVPLNETTKLMVDEQFIENCKSGVIFINTSRGKVMDTKALNKGLLTNKIGGLCIDVFENEKPQTYSESEKLMYDELFSHENVVVSPHIAGWTHQSLERISDVLLNKIGKV